MIVHNSWLPFFKEMEQDSNFKKITEFLKEQNTLNKTFFPPINDIFTAFKYDLNEIKVVIIGQDPYHNVGQAHGLSFSVMPNVKLPPSLKNIYKEIETEFNITMNHNNGYLIPWVEQGVFLLNTSLTVEAHKAGSHSHIGWDEFTNKALQYLMSHKDNLVFMLWGSHAQKMLPMIKENNLILTSAHPSPFSVHRGFFGNNHFIKANDYLKEKGQSVIDWQIN